MLCSNFFKDGVVRGKVFICLATFFFIIFFLSMYFNSIILHSIVQNDYHIDKYYFDDNFDSACEDEGEWIEQSSINQNYSLIASRVTKLQVQEGQDWFKQACPAQSIIYTCYFREGMANISYMLERRKWVSKNHRCQHYHPLDLLKVVKNRSIFFFGDSIMGQIWEYHVCALYSFLPAKFELEEVCPYDSCEKYGCPFGTNHCHMNRGTVHFPTINASYYYERDGKYGSYFYKYISNRTKPDDIVLFNWGIIYNDQEEYLSDLKILRYDLLNWSRSLLPKNSFFLESTPQHFSGEGSWKPGSKYCVPLSSTYKDWRNQIVHDIFNITLQRHLDLYIIPLAKGLYSQYDSHPVHSVNGNFDCSHFCFPGGSFDYIHRQIYNKLRYHLLKNK